jgi:predicted nucleic acid-binding protein
MYLGKLGLLLHLPKRYEPIITCTAVKKELMEDQSAPEHAALDIAFSSWLSIKDPEDSVFTSKLLGLNIHAGEAGVIALARESKYQNVLIIDDLNARDISRTLGIKVTGTLGIMLEFLKNGLITSEDAIRDLKYLVEKTTFRLSTKLYSRVLEKFEDYRKST